MATAILGQKGGILVVGVDVSPITAQPVARLGPKQGCVDFRATVCWGNQWEEG